MTARIQALEQRLAEIVPSGQVSVDPRVLQTNSEDYAWFSNVLADDLAGYRAEVVAWPANEAELAGILAAAYELRVPVTVRGGGTGNYGQCVPLHGGLIVNMSRLTGVLEVGQGSARVGAGVRIATLDRAAAPGGQEVRIYPSTYLTATVAGFVGGGSGGIGSVTHGMLADGNVLAATVYPVDAAPRPQRVEGADLALYIHAYGTTGVMADVTVPLAPRLSWEQAVISFPTLLHCHYFCMDLLLDDTVDKRLITSVEPSIVRYFLHSPLPFNPDRSAALLMFGAGQRERVMALAARHGGVLDVVLPPDSRTRLTDFTWNHTTLWVKKANPALTYLQAAFVPERYEEQVRAIAAEYGEDFAMHGEYARAGGAPFTGSLPIVAYKGREHLARMIAFLDSIGVSVANPHTYVLEEGSRTDNAPALLAARQRNDPAGLLNPGKLAISVEGRPREGGERARSTMGLASWANRSNTLLPAELLGGTEADDASAPAGGGA